MSMGVDMKLRIEGIQISAVKLARRRKAKGYSNRDLATLRDHANIMAHFDGANHWRLVSFHSRRRKTTWFNKHENRYWFIGAGISIAIGS